MGMRGDEVGTPEQAAKYRDPDEPPQPVLGARLDQLGSALTDAEALVERLAKRLEPVRVNRPHEIGEKAVQEASRSPVGDVIGACTDRVHGLGREVRTLLDEIDL